MSDDLVTVQLTLETVEEMRAYPAKGAGYSACKWARDLVEHNPLPPPPLTRGDFATPLFGPAVGCAYVIVAKFDSRAGGRGLVGVRSGPHSSDWRGHQEIDWGRVDPDTLDPAERAALLACAFITEEPQAAGPGGKDET